MKKRNVCMLLAAALSCSLLLTACGGGGTSTTTPGTMKEVEMSKNLTTIGANAFYNTGLESFTLP